MALKLDLQKAYNRVHCGFLKIVLNQFGFCPKFIGWIMQCISYVSFSIMVNGGITKKFHPSRGLQQGNPLSPYLFILGQEVLSRIIDREFLKGILEKFKFWMTTWSLTVSGLDSELTRINLVLFALNWWLGIRRGILNCC